MHWGVRMKYYYTVTTYMFWVFTCPSGWWTEQKYNNILCVRIPMQYKL